MILNARRRGRGGRCGQPARPRGAPHSVNLQVRLGHVRHVRHQVADTIAAIGCGVQVRGAAAALLAVDAVARHRRGRLAGRLALDQAGVVILPRPGALLDDAALLVGHGGEAAAAVVENVAEAQAEDDGHRHDGR